MQKDDILCTVPQVNHEARVDPRTYITITKGVPMDLGVPRALFITKVNTRESEVVYAALTAKVAGMVT